MITAEAGLKMRLQLSSREHDDIIFHRMLFTELCSVLLQDLLPDMKGLLSLDVRTKQH